VLHHQDARSPKAHHAMDPEAIHSFNSIRQQTDERERKPDTMDDSDDFESDDSDDELEVVSIKASAPIHRASEPTQQEKRTKPKRRHANDRHLNPKSNPLRFIEDEAKADGSSEEEADEVAETEPNEYDLSDGFIARDSDIGSDEECDEPPVMHRLAQQTDLDPLDAIRGRRHARQARATDATNRKN